MPDELPPLDEECFFVAPIGAEGSETRQRSDGVLNYIVARAAKDLGLTAVRADQLADPGQITLQVIEHVMGAPAVVADLTGNNPNVFYELAVRHAAQKPVVQIADRDSDLPFDIAQMRTIFFDHRDLASAAQCQADIVAQLRRAFDGGAVDSPIATALDLRSLEGGSAVERQIADILTNLNDLARAQREQSDLMARVADTASKEWMAPDQAKLQMRAVELYDVTRRLYENTATDTLAGAEVEQVHRLARFALDGAEYLARQLVSRRADMSVAKLHSILGTDSEGSTPLVDPTLGPFDGDDEDA